jgi:hypothetical protein
MTERSVQIMNDAVSAGEVEHSSDVRVGVEAPVVR